MKTLEILKERKGEIIEATLEVLPQAIAGNTGMFVASLAFFYLIDDDDNLTVDYYPYVGSQIHSDNVFWTIPGHNVPSAYDLGIETLDDISDVDWGALDYDSFIENIINMKIEDLEIFESIN
jgi:hypothetical protein